MSSIIADHGVWIDAWTITMLLHTYYMLQSTQINNPRLDDPHFL